MIRSVVRKVSICQHLPQHHAQLWRIPRAYESSSVGENRINEDGVTMNGDAIVAPKSEVVEALLNDLPPLSWTGTFREWIQLIIHGRSIRSESFVMKTVNQDAYQIINKTASNTTIPIGNNTGNNTSDNIANNIATSTDITLNNVSNTAMSIIDTRNGNEMESKNLTNIDFDAISSKLDSMDNIVPSDYWFAKFLPIETLQSLMEACHSHFGIPFWFMAVSLPFFARTMFSVPLGLISYRKYEKALPQLSNALRDYNSLVSQSKKQKNAIDFQYQIKKLVSNYGFHPVWIRFRTLVPLMIQIPIHATCYVSLKTMYPRCEEWSQGGMLWFTDLSAMDESSMLYLGCAIVSVATMYSLRHKQFLTKFKREFPRTAEIYYLPIPPSLLFMALVHNPYIRLNNGLTLYLLGNLASFTIQNQLFNSDKFRYQLGLHSLEYHQMNEEKVNEVSNIYTKVENLGREKDSRTVFNRSNAQTLYLNSDKRNETNIKRNLKLNGKALKNEMENENEMDNEMENENEKEKENEEIEIIEFHSQKRKMLNKGKGNEAMGQQFIKGQSNAYAQQLKANQLYDRQKAEIEERRRAMKNSQTEDESQQESQHESDDEFEYEYVEIDEKGNEKIIDDPQKIEKLSKKY